ncbi:MAG: hypothetical protein KA004_15355 [Verrucomicrobiales bacterium]|nr:hypothetical protein [Verrucomicrobiales bacterium]
MKRLVSLALAGTVLFGTSSCQSPYAGQIQATEYAYRAGSISNREYQRRMDSLYYADSQWHRNAETAAMAAVAVGALAIGAAAVHDSYHHHHGHYSYPWYGHGHYGHHYYHCD